jgi:hypothetical protein
MALFKLRDYNPNKHDACVTLFTPARLTAPQVERVEIWGVADFASIGYQWREPL